MFGTLIGWLASIVTKTDSTFDSLLAGGLGAMLALAVLNMVRAWLRPD